MKEWSFGYTGGVKGQWPRNEDGETVAPAFLERLPGDAISAELERNMLASFGIATVCKYPNNGELGIVYLGNAACGVELYVPETQLEEARALLDSGAEDGFDVLNEQNEDINEEEDQ